MSSLQMANNKHAHQAGHWIQIFVYSVWKSGTGMVLILKLEGRSIMTSKRVTIYLQALIQQSNLSPSQIAQMTLCPLDYLNQVLAGKDASHTGYNLAIALLYCQTFQCEIPVMAAWHQSRDVSPEPLKPPGGQLGVAHGVLNVFVSEIQLNAASIVAFVG